MVDAFVSGDGHVLQLPGGMQHKSSYHHHHHMQHIVTRLASALTLSAGMQAWERGFIHEYAGAKGLLHHTTEVCSSCFRAISSVTSLWPLPVCPLA